ncbi:MAG: hypothetical protein HY001_02905 [Candidatus Portnoybacteria bacterium]|nr:hypothetical protein [Candidatus Portnoybacteria bacterium]
MNPETQNCQNCKKDFIIEVDDFGFYEKIKIPPPTFCPHCRFERRATYRNERNLFWNKSAKSGERLLALYPLQSGVAVYHENEWKADDWDGLDYGKDYDFNRTFFEQFHELVKIVPKNARSNEINVNVNSDYTANASHLRNCYLIFNSDGVENCSYGNAVDGSKECLEMSYSFNCELSYESFWNTNCYGTHFSSHCEKCADVWFSKDCIGCVNCFGCVNLRHKNFYIFNQPYSKEDYEKKLSEMRLNSWGGLQKILQEAHAFWLKNPVKYIQGIQNTNVTGEYVSHSRNIHQGYLIRESENLRYCQYQMVPTNKDCMDITVWGGGNQLSYENTTCGWGMFNVKFCVECWPEVRDTEYSMFMRNSKDCFGCVGLRNKQYCIFNKQFSKKEFFELRKKIVDHMNLMPYTDKKGNVYKYGEFFPIEHSLFGHNTSIAGEHFALSREETIQQGYPWDESESHEYKTTIQAKELPDTIEDVSDEILSAIISCTECRRAYRIIKMELDFLRKEKIPLPRLCVNCRHKERVSQRNSFKLFQRQCMCNKKGHFHRMKCDVEFETSYSPDRPETVYCEKCYQQEVY